MKRDAFTEAYLKIINESSEVEVASNNEVVDGAATETAAVAMKQVCFKTADAVLIDALNSGVEEVVLFVNAKDEATGEDTIAEVKLTKEAFKDLAISDVEEVVTEDGEEGGDGGEDIGDIGGDDGGDTAE